MKFLARRRVALKGNYLLCCFFFFFFNSQTYEKFSSGERALPVVMSDVRRRRGAELLMAGFLTMEKLPGQGKKN